ncbi:MAG: Hydrolase, alpha/beta fold family, partial [uncultured Solirubrobacteraceae bacterium]
VLPVARRRDDPRPRSRGRGDGDAGRRATPWVVDPLDRTSAGSCPLLPRQRRQHHQPRRLCPAPLDGRLRRAAVRLPGIRPQQRPTDRGRVLPRCARGARPTAGPDRRATGANALSRRVAGRRRGPEALARSPARGTGPPVGVHQRPRHGARGPAPRAPEPGPGRVSEPAADTPAHLSPARVARRARRHRRGGARSPALRRRARLQAPRGARPRGSQRPPGAGGRRVDRGDPRLERDGPRRRPGVSRRPGPARL